MPTRREVLTLGAAAALSAVPGVSAAQRGPWRPPKRVLRIAHLTDIHVQPERQAALGMETCLDKAQSFHPDVIFLGGDMVMDCLTQTRDRVRAQWDVFDRVLASNVSTKVEACLGNHDIWGWGQYQAYKSESGFGKRYALDRLELDRSYRSFNRAGWHFIFLDSNHRRSSSGYIARIDDEQFEWLEDDLRRTPKDRPILIVSHIPIISAAAYMHGMNEASGDWKVPSMWMHIDARRIKDLFKGFSNVKACVAGHVHLVDHVRYAGVSYYSNGAVCAGWWAGEHQECRNGFGLIDLFDNGFVENRYIPFEWTPRP